MRKIIEIYKNDELTKMQLKVMKDERYKYQSDEKSKE